MMNWRKVVCVLCAGLLCTGLVLANGPAKATKASANPQVQSPVAQTTPAPQSSFANAGGTIRESGERVGKAPLPSSVRNDRSHFNNKRTCVNVIQDNLESLFIYPSVWYYPSSADVSGSNTQGGWAFPIAGETQVSCFNIAVLDSVGGNLHVELSQDEFTPAFPGAVFDVTLPGGNAVEYWQFDLGGAVTLPTGEAFVKLSFADGNSGIVFGTEYGLGTTNYYWYQQLSAGAFYWWFGGYPYAGPAITLYGPEATAATGACCQSGSCLSDGIGYEDCMFAGGDHWHLGQTCSTVACEPLGACCKGGSCIYLFGIMSQMFQTTCGLQQGIFVAGGDCNDPGFSCPAGPPNDNCTAVTPFALDIGSPVTLTGDNSGASSDCPLLGWAEVWFEFTLSAPGDVKIDWCGSPTYQGTIGIAMVPDCPCSSWFGTSEYAWDCSDGLFNPHVVFRNLAAATYYYPMYSAGTTGPYQITFTALQPCDVTCPPGATNELEVCCSDPSQPCYPNGTNGGCNSSGQPGDFEPIACGETVCGTVWADNSWRDTDWYQITTTDGEIFTWSLTGEAPMLGFIINGSGGCPGSIISYALAAPCETLTITSACLPAGTYWMWAGPSTWGNFPCDQVYYGTLTCQTCTPPPPPWNDNCEAVTPVPLGLGQTLTFTGDNTGATPECGLLGWPAEVWYAFTTTETLDVSVDLCGTIPSFLTLGIVLSDCPCTTLYYYTTYDFSTCGDGNGTVFFMGLPAGTWYYPVYTASGSMGPYTLHIKSLVPQPWCDGGAQICDERIERVTVADLDNISDCGLGSPSHVTGLPVPGYSDYSAMQVHMTPGTDYAITVLNGPNIYYGDSVDVWLDLNGDLFFTDPAGHYLLNTTDYATYTGTLNVPVGSAASFIMRLRMDYFGAHNPCGITTYGEVEDYTVVTGTPEIKGDCNCDGLVNAFDIDPFVKCLVGGGPTPPCTDCNMADINGDGLVNAFDIDPFVQCVVNNGCP